MAETYTCQLFTSIEDTPRDADGVRWSQWQGADGTVYRFKDLPFGAMWINTACAWTDCAGRHRGGCLNVKIPVYMNVQADPDGHPFAQFWQVDHPAGGSTTPWDRTGTPPDVTARPSIMSSVPNGYHAWLTAGKLVPV